MSRHVSPRRVRRSATPWGRPRLAVAVAAAAVLAGTAAGTTVTSAAFTDTARLQLGGSGIGSDAVFGIVLVDTDEVARTAPATEPLAVPVPGADALVPGRTVEVTVHVANNHPVLAADLTALVTAEPVAGTPDITGHLRVTILDATGQPVLGSGDPAAGAVPGTPATLGTLPARGEQPVADAAPWTPGAEASDQTYRVLVHYLEDPATAELNGGQAHLAVQLAAQTTDVTT